VSTGFEYDGVVEPVKQSTISSQASGRVATISVKAGDQVRAGQLLATIDDRETQTGVQRSQAQVSQADAELRNAQANAERTRELQAKGFVSKAALDTAELQLKAAKAGQDVATAGARQSALSQGFTRVTAPYDGWVLQTLSEAGDLAVPGKPLMTLYAPLPLRAGKITPLLAPGGPGGPAAGPVCRAGHAARGRAADQRDHGQCADPVPGGQQRPTCRTWWPARPSRCSPRSQASNTPIRFRARAWPC
jgi:multidrug efflux pump subunit AcrA (membrane-fusion protein)